MENEVVLKCLIYDSIANILSPLITLAYNNNMSLEEQIGLTILPKPDLSAIGCYENSSKRLCSRLDTGRSGLIRLFVIVNKKALPNRFVGLKEIIDENVFTKANSYFSNKYLDTDSVIYRVESSFMKTSRNDNLERGESLLGLVNSRRMDNSILSCFSSKNIYFIEIQDRGALVFLKKPVFIKDNPYLEDYRDDNFEFSEIYNVAVEPGLSGSADKMLVVHKSDKLGRTVMSTFYRDKEDKLKFRHTGNRVYSMDLPKRYPIEQYFSFITAYENGPLDIEDKLNDIYSFEKKLGKKIVDISYLEMGWYYLLVWNKINRECEIFLSTAEERITKEPILVFEHPNSEKPIFFSYLNSLNSFIIYFNSDSQFYIQANYKGTGLEIFSDKIFSGLQFDPGIYGTIKDMQVIPVSREEDLLVTLQEDLISLFRITSELEISNIDDDQ